MNVTTLSLGLDVLILICLVFTIYYALRLSRSLDNFRSYRKEFNRLIKELNKNIEKAGQAMDDMKFVSEHSGKQLQKTIEASKALADDLDLLGESGEKLAARLEKLMSKSRRIAQGLEDEPGAQEYDEQLYSNIEHLETGMKNARDDDHSQPFSIQDRDFEDESAGADIPEDLQSQAERELFLALQKNRRKTSSG